MTVQMTVIGLDQIGGSIGLAIKAGAHPITRIGNDKDILNEQKALKMGAFDRVIHNIPASVEESDIVVLCLPVDEVRKTLEIISPALRPGAVLFDTSALKSAVQNWADTLLPEDQHLLPFFPILNPKYLENRQHDLDLAHPDLFQNSVVMICASEKSHPDAVKLAADFSTLLGAKPYFTDLAEAEGLMALVHHLPQISAAAIFRAVEAQSGWIEARKIAGSLFYHSLTPLDKMDETKDLGIALLNNSENTVRVLDAYIQELRSIREMIARQDAESLKKSLTEAVDGRVLWVNKRHANDWDQISRPQLPTTGQWLGKLIGFGGKLKDLDKPKK